MSVTSARPREPSATLCQLSHAGHCGVAESVALPPFTYILHCRIIHDTLSATAFVAQLAERRTRLRGRQSSILTEGLGVAFFATGLAKFTHSQNILIVYLIIGYNYARGTVSKG